MSEDPAFLFYPGNASEDTQFMNRLERGCYFDLLKAQKKFRKFTLEQIKKVLGKDFEPCWASIELVLVFDGEYYYIGWANDSIEKRMKFRGHQSINGKKGGRPSKKQEIKPEENPNETQNNPTLLNGFQNKKPLENENEIKDDEERGSAEGKGNDVVEKDPSKFYPDKNWIERGELDANDFDNTVVYLERTTNKKIDRTEIDRQWKAFKIQYFNGEQAYQGWFEVVQHFRDWMKRSIQKNTNDGNNRGNHSKTSRADDIRAGQDTTAELLRERLGEFHGG